MNNGRRSGTRVGGGKYWLAGGVMVAGLSAAVMTGTATASASTEDPSSPGTSTSTSATTDTETSESTRDAEQATKGSRADTEEEAPEEEAPEEDVPEEEAIEEEAPDEPEEEAEDEASEEPQEDVTEDEGDEPEVSVAPVVAGKDPEESVSAASDRHTTKASASAAETEQEPVAESATAAVSLRTTAAPASDPVLVAAATSTKVTLGSMIVDMLYSWGIRSSKMGTDWLDIAVSDATATRWLTRRAQIYRDVVIPEPEDPDDPSDPKLLWETNFSSMEEAMKYWGFQTGRWGQSAGENQYYTDGDNVYIDADGNLVIDARREAAPDGLGAPYNYTSARVVTMGKQSFGVGQRIVARIQMPVTEGVLPAFWSVGLEPGHEYDWPRQGEIDIVEIPTLGTPESASQWTGNIHGPSAANNTVDVKLHNINTDLGVDVSQGFHEYGIDWHADRIVWHVDGVEVGQITKAQYEALGGNWTPFSGAWDHYLILNVAVGNPWNGDPDPSQPFQAQMKVDWVKAYDL